MVKTPSNAAAAGRRRILQASLAAPLAGMGSHVRASGACMAQAPLALDRRRLDATLAAMVAQRRAAGVSALVWQAGAERYFGAAGHADLDTQRPMARDTLARIYSMTKPVAAVALMQLWEEGRFALDDPLSRHLPDFAEVRVRDAVGVDRPPRRPILVRDLLRHTAGLTYGMTERPADEAFRAADPLNTATSLRDLGRRIAGLPLQFEPGAQWGYSTAVDVVAVLVEVLSGRPFEAQVRRRVLQPLGMRHTGWTLPPGGAARLAHTYFHAEDGRVQRHPEPPPQPPSGGSGLVSSIDDYMRFARMLLAGGELDGERILQASTLRLMATDQLDPCITERHFLPEKGAMGFGLGFAVRVAPPRDAAENRGTVGEFFWDGMASTLFWVDPVHDLAAVFFTQKLPYDGTLHRDIRAAVYG